jgi:hypothetical protein
VLTEGDLVFTVGTRGAPTQQSHKGRVLGVFRVSDLEVNTQDHGLPRKQDRPELDSVARFPFALHPIAVWEITSPDNIFAELVGPLTPNHHLHAQSRIVALNEITAAPLLESDREEVKPALPKTEFGTGLNQQHPAHRPDRNHQPVLSYDRIPHPLPRSGCLPPREGGIPWRRMRSPFLRYPGPKSRAAGPASGVRSHPLGRPPLGSPSQVAKTAFAKCKSTWC